MKRILATPRACGNPLGRHYTRFLTDHVADRSSKACIAKSLQREIASWSPRNGEQKIGRPTNYCGSWVSGKYERLAALDLAQHTGKTFIGRIEREFDFLGYHFSRKGLAVAEKTLTHFVERLTRLYEQGRNAQDRALRLGRYVRRWVGWDRGGTNRQA